jgi:Matrixin
MKRNDKEPLNMPLLRKPRVSKFETLEERRVFANFGTPWPDARHLSVSFPSDDASIGPYQNSMRSVFDQVADRAKWQEETLRAFQTWAFYSNINVGLVPDRGDDFGTIGLSTKDPRFGEFRIGAFPQPGVLASAAPYQQIAGTWSGDVLLNTQTNYFLGDWQSPAPIDVPEPNGKGPAVELFSVLLHEAGNALGVADNHVAGAVMNGTYSGPNGKLKASDIAAIRSLYGPKRDIYETRNNNLRTSATPIAYPPAYNGAEPVSVQGSLNSLSDVDFYRITPLRNRDIMTVRLWAAGISLVKAKVEVLDALGNKIADVKADSIFNNNLQLRVGSLRDHRTLFIKVSRNTPDVFAVGDYRLEVDYRAPELQPSIFPPPHDADAVDDDGGEVDFVSVDALFAQFGLLDTETGANDTLTTAIPLETTTGFLTGSRYEVSSSVSNLTDRDLWKFRSPSFASPTLHINVDTVGIENPVIEAVLLNVAGDRIASKSTRKADGGISMEVANPQSNHDYVLFVRTRSGSVNTSGNYVATFDFATAESPQALFSGRVDPLTEDISRLDVNKTQLFRFDLQALATFDSSGVQMSFYNARTGDLVNTLAAAAGTIRTEYLWLSEGAYYLRATSRVQAGHPQRVVNFSLRADVVSDDQGPMPIDPTLPPPPPVNPLYIWTPISPFSPPPIINSLEPPIENPWSSGSIESFYANYYPILIA